MSNNEKTEWLASLKPGDQILARNGSYGMSIVKVERITKARIFAGHHSYHLAGNRAGGRVGDAGSWSWGSIEPVTQEIRDEVATKALRAKMRESVNWNALTLAQLRAIDVIVSDVQP